jgi:hypothetical protein
MSLISYGERDIGADAGRQADIQVAPNVSFRFVPKELTAKCRKLLESHHAMHGYGSLPDMLWHSHARDIIECHRDLADVFKNACKSRCAKRANEALLLIATAIVSLEVLARDFAGWGKRYPAAKRDADLLLGEFQQWQHHCLMDMYMYPELGIRREFAQALAPLATPAHALPRQ